MKGCIMLNDVELPVVKKGGVKYYPIAMLFNKCLDLKLTASDLSNKDDMKSYIIQAEIDYGYDTGGVQTVKCINSDGIEYYFKNYLRIGKLDGNKRSRINQLIDIIKINHDKFNEGDRYIINYNYKGKYDIFIEDCIDAVIKECPDIEWQQCNKCGNYFPLHISFFYKNPDCTTGFLNICRDCQKWTQNRSRMRIVHPDKLLDRMYREYGKDTFLIYKHRNIIKVFDHCYKNKLTYPDFIRNKDYILEIILYLFTNKRIEIEDLNEENLRLKYNIHINSIRLTQRDIYLHLFGDEWLNYPWKFPNIKIFNFGKEYFKQVFANYIKEFNIKIDEVYNFDYASLFKEIGIYHHIQNDLLGFVMDIHDNKYPAYKFNISAVNYWKSKENRIKALKYFIEEDRKIPIDKTPLYLTKMTLQKYARTLYMILYNGKYYSNIWQWVNECYPNKYIENDFIINSYRDRFDSTEEMELNDLLHTYFKYIIYNQNNTERTIKIKDKVPDWLAFTNEGCILIEYFGLWKDNLNNVSHRNEDYIKRSKDKIKIYESLKYYKFIALYPKDLENDFQGVKNKIQSYRDQ